MYVLGIHGGVTINQHDAAACIFKNGKLVVAIEEERLTRIKSSNGMMPVMSVRACLKEANLNIKNINYVTVIGKTYKDIKKRTAEWFFHHFGHSPIIKVVDHQLAHASSAFYHSDFKRSAIITYDAWGDRLSGLLAVGDKKKGIKIYKKITASNSLGAFYSAMTSFLGFKPNEDEYKVMGLAPYGKNTFDLSFFCKPHGKFFYCNTKYFKERNNSTVYEQFYSKELIKKLGKPRLKDQKIVQKYKNIACSTQYTLEESAINLIKNFCKLTNEKNICFAGGVALNCTLNGRIIQENYIKKIFIQPAASDRGLALGGAMYFLSQKKIKIQKIKNVFFGPNYSKKNILEALKISGLNFIKIKNAPLLAAKLLASGKILGWYQGRSEFGPRALGNRSILANPSLKWMKNKINKKIKFREEFRPFAPSVLIDKSKELFNIKYPSPFMTATFDVKNNWSKKIPATTHINNTARVQTVSINENKKFYNLIKNFYKITGVPCVLNTSFNIRGQPIVETPFDALATFAANGVDCLIIDDYYLKKNKNY
jgi:carbamoyltransferase